MPVCLEIRISPREARSRSSAAWSSGTRPRGGPGPGHSRFPWRRGGAACWLPLPKSLFVAWSVASPRLGTTASRSGLRRGITPAAAPPPATTCRRRIWIATPAPVGATDPIHAEPSVPIPAAPTPRADPPPGLRFGILRHEHAERGAHEGRAGQLYRPTPRDGALGHACGQAIQFVVFT